MTDVTLRLTGDAAATMQRLMREGGYDTPEAALAAVLSDYALGDDPVLESRLRDVVVSRYDAAAADPARAVSVDEARRTLRGLS